MILFLVGMTMITSCMKNDPENNSTIYYGYQQIPNINEYMPERLLHVMDSMHCLYYGDEPPRIEGSYLVDSILRVLTFHAPGSNFSLPCPDKIGGYRQITFTKQHMGISNLELVFFNEGIDTDPTHSTYGQFVYYPVQKSTTDTTAQILADNIEQILNDSVFPVYFRNSQNNFDVFDHAYIIGNNSYFTVYYYEIKRPLDPQDAISQYFPVYANILSGRIDKETYIEIDTTAGTTDTLEINVIKDFKWGVQTMKYLKRDLIQDMIYNQTFFLKPGDGFVLKSNHVNQVVNQE